MRELRRMSPVWGDGKQLSRERHVQCRSGPRVDSGSDMRALEIAQDCGKSASFLYRNNSCTKKQPDIYSVLRMIICIE